MSSDLTVVDAVVAPCPRAIYAQDVRRAELWWDERLDAWVAVGPEVVRTVLSHPQLGVRPPDAPVPAAFAGTVAGEVFGGFARMSDGARHEERRAAAVEMLNAFTTDDAACSARRVLAREDAWTLPRLQFAAPVMAMGELLGIPSARWLDLVEWTSCFVRGASPAAGPAEVAAAIDAVPPLVRVMEDGENVAGTANRIGLLFQTHDAMAGLVGGALVALARNGDGDVARAFADVFRDDAPVQNTRRYAMSDVRIGEAYVRQGDMVIAVLAATGDDPDGCPFGHGAHRCPGEPIAHAIAREVVKFAMENEMIRDDVGEAVRYHASGNARIPDLRVEEEA